MLKVNGLFESSKGSLVILFFLSFLFFLENYDKSLISVSPIPYIDYGSYEYAILSGPAFTVVYSLSGLLFSLLCIENISSSSTPRVNKFIVLAIATFIFSITFALTAVATEFYQQVLIRIVMSVSQSVITPFSTSIISDNFSSEVRGGAFAVFNVGTYVSFSLSLSLGTYMYIQYGWQASYYIFGLLGVGLSMLIPPLAYLHRPAGLRSSSEDRDNDSLRTEGAHSVKTSISSNSAAYNPVRDSDPAIDMHRDSQQSTSCHVNSDLDLSFEGSSVDVAADGRGLLRRAGAVLHEILFVHWWHRPEIYLLCLATGVRMGGGYIWTSYTAAFFSDLFVYDPDSSCSYSYSATAANPPSSMCSSDFPYCVEDGSCAHLSTYPWHNKGMSSLNLEIYMSWVPLVGSAFGSLLGGFLSDHLVRRNKPFAGDVGDRTNASEESLWKTFDGRERPDGSSAVRMVVAGVGTLMSLPLVLAALVLPLPSCFLIMIASGLVGEVYFSQSLAILTEKASVPAHLVTQSVALFMLCVTVIGGNVPVLVPYLITVVGGQDDVTLTFQAAPEYTAIDPALHSGSASMTGSSDGYVSMSVANTDATQLQLSMMILLGATYGISGLLYLLCAYVIKRKEQR